MEEQGPPPPPQEQQGPPPGWYPQPPPGYWWPRPHPPWQQEQGPGNVSAVAGFALGLGGLGLLVVTLGLLSPISLICGALAIFFGIQGKRAVERGDTGRHAGLARA